MSSSPTPDSSLSRGREAYGRREWRPAFESLSAADDADPLGPDDLWRLALSGYLIGREDVYRSALERAHHGRLESGDAPGAVRAAVWLGLHLAERGEMSRASGWFGRGERLLAGNGADCVERGYLRLPVGLRHLTAGDNEAAARVAAEAVACAQEYGDRELLALAVHLQGRALLRQVRVAEGLALVDEAMVAVATDELSPHVTGLVYCSVISACRRVFALDRAQEWTAALTEWCEAQPDMVAFRGRCRVFRAELLRLQGSWREALAEAGRVDGDGAEGGAVAGAAHYERAEVHRLRGELGAAEEWYLEAGRAGREPQPGLALLRLAQGDTDAAAAAIRRALEAETDPLARARLLPAAVEIRVELGELEAAEAAARELEAAAEACPARALEAMAAQARGTVALARDDPGAALAPLRQAWEGWRALEARHDAARARTLVGRACLALGDDDAAAVELGAARTAFEELGAAPEVRRVDALTGSGSRRGSHGLTPRELEVLAAVSTGKTNRAIAEDLFISEKTVARHVSNIFRKLGLSSRAAATAYAYEHGLTDPPA